MPADRQAVDGRDDEVGSPMPGKIFKFEVAVGEEVEADQPLFVIEAMKMETVVSSKVKGKVKEILLSEGDMVAKNDLIVCLEV